MFLKLILPAIFLSAGWFFIGASAVMASVDFTDFSFVTGESVRVCAVGIALLGLAGLSFFYFN